MENKVISTEYVKKNFIHKDKIKGLRQKIHKELDINAITRGYQLIIDKYFKEALEKTDDEI